MSWEELAALGRRRGQGEWEWPAAYVGDVIAGLAELGWQVESMAPSHDGDWVAIRLSDGEGNPVP